MLFCSAAVGACTDILLVMTSGYERQGRNCLFPDDAFQAVAQSQLLASHFLENSD
jgi:hypothetical protein